MRHRKGALGILAALAVACGGSDQQVVDNYFRAVNAKDTQTLSSFATVEFPKPVQSYKVLSAAAETRVQAPMVELLKRHQDADQGLAENKKAYGSYFLDHPSEVDQVQDLLRKGQPIPAKLASVGADWRKFIDSEKEFKKAVADTTTALEREKRHVILSIGPNEEVETLSGEMVTKTLELALTVEGNVENYTMSLRKYEMKSAAGTAMPTSRWVVTGLEKK